MRRKRIKGSEDSGVHIFFEDYQTKVIPWLQV